MSKVFVLFEVYPSKQGLEKYLELGAKMLALVQGMQGFIRAERFQSLKEEGKLLSLSVWENEEAVDRWREHVEHAFCQQKGRAALFTKYNISITKLVREYDYTHAE